ncbi:uncharacterized protein LOC134269568 isoform X1 [Saccostrea cucullata]|uniref:uncharacterized protein LOC134269568 isoform X1 n=1 Tax=Saccostrea cuccullata TaxID=36930 RepID=UPI002ECFE5B2
MILLMFLLSSGQTLRIANFTRQTGYDGVLPVDSSLIRYSSTHSRVACAGLCSEYEICRTFLYHYSSKDCYIWDKHLDHNSATKPVDEIQTYKSNAPLINLRENCVNHGFTISDSERMCFKYFYNSNPRSKEVILNECQQFGAGLLLLNTPGRRSFFLSQDYVISGTNEAHVGLSDANVEGTWIWDNGDPADDAVLASSTFDNDDDRYTCTEGADCVVVFIGSNSLTFEDYCCKNIKHWYCAIYF